MTDEAKPNEAKPKPDPNVLAAKLQASLQGQRPRRWYMFFGALAVAVLVIGAVLWLMTPPPPSPPFEILALDAVLNPGDEIVWHGQLAVAEADRKFPLAGQLVFFNDGTQSPPSQPCDVNGSVTLKEKLGATPGKKGRVLYHLNPERKKRVEDEGFLYVRLKEDKIAVLEGKDIFKEEPSPGTFVFNEETLKSARAQATAGTKFTYHLYDAATIERFRLLRDAIRGHGFPDGPVLGRWHSEKK